MNAEIKQKIICCVLATIIFLWGISVVVTTANSSFLSSINVKSTTNTILCSTDHIMKESVVCIPSMLNKSMDAIRSRAGGSWQNKSVYLFLVVGCFLQYLFYYQSAESKEDGQLFLCRSVIVDYIHLKDSGE